MAIEQKHLDQAMALAKTYGATRLILFGSALSHPDQAHDLDWPVMVSWDGSCMS